MRAEPGIVHKDEERARADKQVARGVKNQVIETHLAIKFSSALTACVE